MDKTENITEFKTAGMGWEIGDSTRFIPAYIREHFRIHYITGGTGWLKTQNNNFCLTEGFGFVIFPGEAFDYYPAEVTPWEYFWMGLKGDLIEEIVLETGMSRKHPIFKNNGPKDGIRELIANILACQILQPHRVSDLEELVCSFFHQIEPIETKEKGKSQYVEDSLKFIHENYRNVFTIQDIADSLFINRTYLYKLFRSYLHTSPQAYIIDYRITKACEKLVTTDIPISKIASEIGFRDFSDFHRQFRKRKSMSPSNFRSLDRKKGNSSSHSPMKTKETTNELS